MKTNYDDDWRMFSMNNYKKQFNKGILELGILKLLTIENQYGYSIIQEIKKQSNDKIEIKDGTLYPILYRLEDHKLIESYWETKREGRGKPRKYYKITTLGIERFDEMLAAFLDVNQGIHHILKL